MLVNRRKGYKMQNAKKGTATQKATVKTPATLTGGADLTYAQIWAFVNESAGGNLHNVQVVPLGNVQLDQPNPVPFGYGGRAGGVRQQIQDWLLHGVNGNNSLASILNAAAPLGHSRKKPVCLMAMLQGGYSPSSATWGTPFVQLVVQPQPTK